MVLKMVKNNMKIIFTFFKIWFGMISECWQDAKIINDKKVREAFRDLCKEIDLDQQYID